MPNADAWRPLYLAVQAVCLCCLLTGSCSTPMFPDVLTVSDDLTGSACQNVWQAPEAFPCCVAPGSRQSLLTRSCCQGCASGPGWSARWLPTTAELGTGPASSEPDWNRQAAQKDLQGQNCFGSVQFDWQAVQAGCSQSAEPEPAACSLSAGCSTAAQPNRVAKHCSLHWSTW